MAVDSLTAFYSWSLRSPTKCCAFTVMDRSRYTEVQNRNPTNFPENNFIDDSSTYMHNFYILSLNFLLWVWLSVRGACLRLLVSLVADGGISYFLLFFWCSSQGFSVSWLGVLHKCLFVFVSCLTTTGTSPIPRPNLCQACVLCRLSRRFDSRWQEWDKRSQW